MGKYGTRASTAQTNGKTKAGKSTQSLTKPSPKATRKSTDVEDKPTTIAGTTLDTRDDKSKETPKAQPIQCMKCAEITLEIDDITSPDEYSISCDSCNQWIHRGCTDLTATEFKVLQKGNAAILFKCEDCLKTNGKENKALSSIESKLTEMMNMMGDMKNQILKEVEDKIDYKLKETQQQEKMESAIRIELNQRLDVTTEDEKERKEIEEKSNNIILHNVEEQELENDNHKIEEIIKILDPQGSLAPNTGNLTIKRLGKKKSPEKGITLRPRPVQIVLPNPNSKNGILKNSRNLRDSKYQQISVRPDLTRKQQEIDYKLRQQLRQRKDKKEDVIIYKGEIIQRVDHPNYKPSQIETPPTNAY